jgi:DNA-binding transcriptional regulator YhcF (GntR family)
LSIWTTKLIEATLAEVSSSLDLIKKKFKESLSLKIMNIRIEPQIGSVRPDFIAEVCFKKWQFKLVGEIIKQPSSSVFRNAFFRLKSYVSQSPDLVPLLISKYLSEGKRKECKEEGINFMDLSGNVFLQYGEGLYIERTGFPNQFPEIRKGRNPFSDKASLLLRAMLKKKKFWGVRELANAVRLNPGYVSRMFKELEDLRYLMRLNSKAKLKNQKSILEDWIHHYDYKKNNFLKYHCLAKSPQEIIDKLKKMNISAKVNYALGFHAGAFLISPYAAFNEVHIYISDEKSSGFFKTKLSLKPVAQGANVLLVSPYYKHSVFYDMQKINKLMVVSDIQLYLDLYHYPLRGLEQAEHLYEKRIKTMLESRDVTSDG